MHTFRDTHHTQTVITNLSMEKIILIESSNKVSHNVLINSFSDKGINFSERILSDSSFPSVKGTMYAEISISHKYLKEVEEVLNEGYKGTYMLRHG